MDDLTKDKVRRIAVAAIEEAQHMGFSGADIVKSGFNAAVRRIGAVPHDALRFLVESGEFETRERGRVVPNIILYHKGGVHRVEVEEKAASLLEAAGIEAA